ARVFAAIFLSVAAAPVRAERITLATYNLENYVSVGRRVDGVYRENYPKPAVEKDALHAVIADLRADVIVLQEMGPVPYLRELQNDLAREGQAYPYGEVLEAADRERHVAMISRRPFAQVVGHDELRLHYFDSSVSVKRGLLEARFKVGHTLLTVFAVHLKSRLTERADDEQSAVERLGEARAVRDCILLEFPDPRAAAFVLLGDCNDVPKSKPITALLHRGKTKIFELVPAADSRGETWTEWYRREDSYSRIDYAMVSPGIVKAVVGDSARIGDGPETLIASDHRPVVVTLDLP
ncbi:MAG TPA: endonuclease/exonuclease/phosphatase family protein, partial [Opitutaceae bacterium]